MTGHVDLIKDLDANQLYHVQEGISTDGDIAVDPGITIVKRPTVSTQDIKPTTAIHLWPSPARDFVYLGYDGQLNGVFVHDISGIEVLSASPDDKKLDVSQLKQGLYFVVMHGSEGIGISKLVKL